MESRALACCGHGVNRGSISCPRALILELMPLVRRHPTVLPTAEPVHILPSLVICHAPLSYLLYGELMVTQSFQWGPTMTPGFCSSHMVATISFERGKKLHLDEFRMCVYVEHVCSYDCICVYTYGYTWVYIYIYIYILVHMYTCVQIYVHKCVCTWALYMCEHGCINVCICMCI